MVVQTPNAAKFRPAVTRGARDVSTVQKFKLPEMWTKIHQNPLKSITHQCPHYPNFHRAPPNDVREKRCKYYILEHFSDPVGPLGQNSPVTALMHNKARTIRVPNFVPF